METKSLQILSGYSFFRQQTSNTSNVPNTLQLDTVLVHWSTAGEKRNAERVPERGMAGTTHPKQTDEILWLKIKIK